MRIQLLVANGLVDLHFDRFGLGLFRFRQMHGQHSIPKFCRQLLFVHQFRHRVASREAPIGPFDPMVPPAFFFLRLIPLTRERQYSAFY